MSLTMRGFRVVACAYKEIQDIGYTMNLTREEIEYEVEFVGFLILENPLKDDSIEVATRLKKSNLDLKIISGDNPLTTIQCARQLNFFLNTNVYLVDFEGELKVTEVPQLQKFEQRSKSMSSEQPSIDQQVGI